MTHQYSSPPLELTATHLRSDAERDTHDHQVHAKDIPQQFLLPEEKLDGVRSILEDVTDKRDCRLGPWHSCVVDRTEQPEGEVGCEADSDSGEVGRRGE